MSEEPRVDVVVVSYETRETLLECLAALVAEPTASVVVIDNASRDGTAAAVRERFPSVRLVANAENVGFARACNQGARESRAPYLLFLNPDATLAPGSLGALAAILEARPRVGVVGPRTRSANGDIQVSTGPDLSLVSEIRQRRLVRGVARRDAAILVEAEGLHAVEREVDWVSGACLMIRREAFDAVSGFDERFFLYEEDADLCRRVRAAGWKVLFSPGAEARHALGRSMARSPERARLEYQRSHLLYYRKHCGLAQRLALRLWLFARAELALVLAALLCR
jgi:N-acetylglucosaminyl-diphospho-decaprenol L-rhamnosyltransferase